MKRITLIAGAFMLVLVATVTMAQTTSTPKEKKSTVPQMTAASTASGEHKLQLTKDDIIAMQKALSKAGYLKGKAGGTIDPATTAALREYQKSMKLEVTGWPDAPTLTKLGVPYKPAMMNQQNDGAQHQANKMTEKKDSSQKPR